MTGLLGVSDRSVIPPQGVSDGSVIPPLGVNDGPVIPLLGVSDGFFSHILQCYIFALTHKQKQNN